MNSCYGRRREERGEWSTCPPAKKGWGSRQNGSVLHDKLRHFSLSGGRESLFGLLSVRPSGWYSSNFSGNVLE